MACIIDLRDVLHAESFGWLLQVSTNALARGRKHIVAAALQAARLVSVGGERTTKVGYNWKLLGVIELSGIGHYKQALTEILLIKQHLANVNELLK